MLVIAGLAIAAIGVRLRRQKCLRYAGHRRANEI